jgi:hypothetical protein
MLALGLTEGVVMPEAMGVVPPATEAAATSLVSGVPLEWLTNIPTDPATGATWTEARSAAQVAGVVLTARRLRVTWLCRQLADDKPVGEIAQRLSLSRADLEAAAANLSSAAPDDYERYLRG